MNIIFAVLYYLFFTIVATIVFTILFGTVFFVCVKLIFESTNAVCKSDTRLESKIVVITGGNSGIGLETARDLASRGATVIIACRDEKKSTDAIADIIKTTGNKNVYYKHLDLSKFSSVRKFAEDFNRSYDRLDILINNAGCFGLRNKTTEDGYEIMMQINYLGPFLLTNLLLDRIKSSLAGRIIIVSSYVHRFGHVKPDKLKSLRRSNIIMKYCDTKLYNIIWMKALAKRLPGNVTVNALHPGFVKTDLYNKLSTLILKCLTFFLNSLDFKTSKKGAQTTIYLAVSDEVANVSGKYFIECAEAYYSSIADDEKLVDKIWEESFLVTS